MLRLCRVNGAAIPVKSTVRMGFALVEESLYRVHATMEDKHWWFVARRKIITDVARKLSQDVPQPFIVDIGCGTGGSLAHFKQEKFQCVGIDSSQIAIDLAAEKFPECDFRCGRMPDDLRDISSEVTLFTLLDVLEHVEDDKKFLSDLVHLAPKGADILITVPALKSLWSPHDVANHHFRRYEKPELEAVWNGLPVTCRMTGFFNARLYPIISMMRSIANLKKSSAGEGGSDFSMPMGPINKALTSIFASESRRIVDQIDNVASSHFKTGTSLIAVLRKEE